MSITIYVLVLLYPKGVYIELGEQEKLQHFTSEGLKWLNWWEKVEGSYTTLVRDFEEDGQKYKAYLTKEYLNVEVTPKSSIGCFLGEYNEGNNSVAL